MAAVFDTKLFL